MSPQRIIGEFLLDSLVALLLFAIAMVATFAVVGLLPAGFWLTGTIFYLAVSPVAFYARWRGHISFFNSDVLVFLPAPLLLGCFFDLFFDLLFKNGFIFCIAFSIGNTCIFGGLIKFRQWVHKSLD